MTMTKPKLLVSACLLGENCKYNGGNNRDEQVRALERYFQLIPVCPECFGGLPIPREPSEIRDGCVVSKSGVDVTAAFADGAEKTLYIAEEENCGLALLKERSPSCGCGAIYDGSFTGALVPGHMDEKRYEFCWIVDFPMYEIGEESGELEFCHNPFSMPNGGLEILEKAERGEVDPLDIYAYQYDLVCNGVELSSGAVRNHDPEIMVKAFELVRLGEDDVKAKFPAMYNAFCYGAPPHAGIAPGVDRMVMLLAGEDCIREIIPFPMNKNAQDVMMGAPSTVEQKQLDELHIQITALEEE